MPYHLLKIIGWLVGWLSEAMLSRLAHLLAWVAFDVIRLRRALVLQNLTRAFPNYSASEKKSVARRCFYHFMLTTLEFFYWQSHPEALRFEVEDGEHLQKVLDQGIGTYMAVGHIGNWEAMGIIFSRAFVPSHVAVKKVGSDAVNRYVQERRKDMGFLAIDRASVGSAYRTIRKVLKRGEIVGFVIDQARPGEPRLPFFGESAKTNTSLAAMWLKNPTPIIPTRIERLGVNYHKIV